MLARVFGVAGAFYLLGLVLMVLQRRRTSGTTRTTWSKYLSYGLFIASALLLAYLGGAPFAAAVLLAMALALHEFFRAARLGVSTRVALTGGGLAIGASALLGGAALVYPVAVGLSLAAVLLAALAREPRAATRSAMWGVMGLVTVATPAAHLLALAGRPQRFLLFVFLFLAVCCADAFAELVGRRWPWGRGLLPVSPAKSIAGVVAGVAAAMGMALALQAATGLWSAPRAIACGAAVGLAGTAGDLVASSMKRALDIKDFGSALPGHGGLLDRLDSLFFAALPFYWIVRG